MTLLEKIKAGEVSVGDLVKNKKATFQYYRQGNLMYETEDGFEFPVPMSDTGDSTFHNEHKAMELMRWIRKQLDLIKSN